MKRTPYGSLPLVLILALLTCGDAATGQNNPVLADPNLEQAVRDELNKPAGDLTAADLAQLTSLYAPNCRISTLAGLEVATNLLVLNVTQNDITNAAAVAALPQLASLNLSLNYVRDLSFLRNLTNLTSLFLEGDSLESVPPLGQMLLLARLGLSDNYITDLAALPGLSSLQQLYLSGNPITSLEPLCGLTNLMELAIGNLSLSNANSLTCLTQLSSLLLYDNHLVDVGPLLSLTNLSSLDLTGNPVADWSPLARLTNLVNLSIGNASLRDIHWVSGLGSLSSLRLDRTSITELSPLASLTNLYSLDISESPVTNYGPLADLPRLHVLYLEGNSLTDLASLAGLYRLTGLSLMRNRISDLAPVRNLTNLVWVHTAYNLLTNISALPELPKLHTVYLHGNLLNPASGSQHRAVIDALESRGVGVYYQPQLERPRIMVRPEWLVPAGQKSRLPFMVIGGGTFWLEPPIVSVESSDSTLLSETTSNITPLSDYSDWKLGLTPSSAQTGMVTLTLAATNGADLWTNVSLQVRIASPTPFNGEPLNISEFSWSTLGEPGWFGQNTVSHDGVSSAQSGANNSLLQTKVTGPGSLKFWFKLESDYYYANAQFTATAQGSNLHGYEHLHRGGEIWQQEIVALSPGEWILQWSPFWDEWSFGGFNTLWVDEVSFTPGPPACRLEPNPYELPNGELQFSLHGTLGRTYQVEFSADLRNWSPLTLVTCANFETGFGARKFASARFYRAKAIP